MATRNQLGSSFGGGFPIITAQQRFLNNGKELSASEQFLLAETKFNADFKKNIVGRSTSRKDISKKRTIKRVSQDNYEDLLNLDLFRGGSLNDVTGTKLSKGTFQKNFKTGEIRRTGGVELSTLDEAGIEQLAQVVSGRQAQIQGRALGTGLQQQSFSLLSGNFG
jgi:hypothetical protein